jgi:hypothetical protein
MFASNGDHCALGRPLFGLAEALDRLLQRQHQPKVGGDAVALPADAGSEADILAAIKAVRALGQPRVAIFNVGNSVAAPSLELSADLF